MGGPCRHKGLKNTRLKFGHNHGNNDDADEDDNLNVANYYDDGMKFIVSEFILIFMTDKDDSNYI